MDFNWRIILLKCLLFFVNILIYRYICGLETYYSTKMFDVWKYWFENFATLMFSVDFNRIFLPQCFPFATQSEEHQSPPTSPPLPCAAKVSSIYHIHCRQILLSGQSNQIGMNNWKESADEANVHFCEWYFWFWRKRAILGTSRHSKTMTMTEGKVKTVMSGQFCTLAIWSGQ